jgi:3-dehydroquinate synthase
MKSPLFFETLDLLFPNLNECLKGYSFVFVLADENILEHCYPLLKAYLPPHKIIQVLSGEENKVLSSCEYIWSKLTNANADRNAVLLNLGGGVIGDVGGFAASCYKRGISFINIPTSLLAMVDASVGGKTGVDFAELKNQIGLFVEAKEVLICPEFLSTLPTREMKAGLAEVVKHYLIADNDALKKMADLFNSDMMDLIQQAVSIKSRFVEADPLELNIRKALNFGHTIGHAVESLYMHEEEPLLHGEAVVVGMICESFISQQLGFISEHELQQITHHLISIFSPLPIPVSDTDALIALMKHDKKNVQTSTRFTLLHGIGNCKIDVAVDSALIQNSIQYFNSSSSENA